MILHGDCLEKLRELPDASVHCCVTSPPYWGLRDYGKEGQLGLEKTPEEYVEKMVAIFREVRRVLRDDGTLWLNLGDSYASQGGPEPAQTKWQVDGASNTQNAGRSRRTGILKPKDLVGIPWRVAFALQSDGWWLRQDIIWHKLNPMPESVRDRCTKAHEYIFLLSKSERYYYDQKAIEEPFADERCGNPNGGGQYSVGSGRNDGGALRTGVWNKDGEHSGRNRRSVWTVTTKPYKGAHFATFPPKLIEPCILAGCPEGGTVLDPFAGSGTTGMVAVQNRRKYILIELNEEYIKLIEDRLGSVQVAMFAG
jgi:DNA modification methylase